MCAARVRPEIRVENQTRGCVLVAAGRVADNSWTRLRGLIGSKPLQSGEGLLIVPCKSIHTHFMSFAIDALFVDRDLQIVAISEDMAPWRFGRVHRRAHFVIEVAAGTAAATGSQPGDQLSMQGYKL